MASGAIGYQRPPTVTVGDLSARGVSTIGSTSPAFAMLQEQAQAQGAAPVQTAAGPRFVPLGGVGIGLIVLLVLAYYLDRRVI
jgi:hypothetical protein